MCGPEALSGVMFKNVNRLFVFTIAWLIAAPPWNARAEDKSCPAIENGSAEDAVTWLRGEREHLCDTCIKAAINKLGKPGYLPATEVLTMYLDYRDPETVDPPDGPFPRRQWGTEYPPLVLSSSSAHLRLRACCG